MEQQINSLEELKVLARRFVESLTPIPNRATVVTLRGELGAGKTAFVQAVAEVFGVMDRVTSPTFVIEKIYKLKRQSFSHLVHIDAYRLENSHELEVLGWHEMVSEPTNIIFIEWAERVKDIFLDTTIDFSFLYINETTRAISRNNTDYGKK